MNRASGQYSKFEQILLQYINVVAPIIQSLWSLEAAHANAADVFVFWLACTATLNDLFLKGTNVTGMSLSLANSITTIFNKCYQEFFTNEVYFTAFALDPHKFGAIVFITFNSQPVIVQGIHFPTYSKSPHQMHQQIIIPSANNRNSQRPVVHLIYTNTNSQVKTFLKDMLHKKLELLPKDTNKPSFKDLSHVQVDDDLRTQLEAYWRNKWPFNQQVKDNDPLAWWKSLKLHPCVQVLAVCV